MQRHSIVYRARCAVRLAWVALAIFIAGVAAPARAELIMALGDSNTGGGADAYPGLLQTTLDQRHGSGRFEVVNHGISGLTTAGLVSELTSATWLDENPDVVLLMIGGNDLWTLFSSPNPLNFLPVVQQAVDGIQQAVDIIRTHAYAGGAVPKIIVSAYVPNKLPNITVGSFSINPNGAVEALNAKLGTDLTNVDLYFANNYADVLDPATGKADVNLMRDNLHLNQAGRQIVAANFADVIPLVVPEPPAGQLAALAVAIVAIVAHMRTLRGAAHAHFAG